MSNETQHLTVVGERAGEYILDEELDDGRLVIRPDTSAQAMRDRLGGEPITGDEFDRVADEYGVLPADGEG